MEEKGKRSLALTGVLAALALLFVVALLGALTQPPPALADPGIRYVDGATGTDAANPCLDPALPCETIGHALGMASPGDAVLVAQGIYTENLTIGGITLTLRGGYAVSEPEWLPDEGETVVNGNNADRTIMIHGNNSVLENLTITGGDTPDGECWGGGLWVTDGDVTIRSSMITGNWADCSGGGLEVNNDWGPAHLTLEDSVVVDNHSDGDAGGVSVWHASAELTNVLVISNTAGNNASALRIEDSDVSIHSSTFADNQGGSAIHAYDTDAQPDELTVRNSIVWGNTEASLECSVHTCSITYSDVEGGWGGESNIDANPWFVDAEGADYHLQPWSLCIDAGTAEGAPDHDLEGDARPQNVGYDMGADEFVGTPIPNEGDRYVATTGSDEANPCLDPALPCETIGHGLEMANPGESVLVAQGVYTENLTIQISTTLEGGYSGVPDWERDLELYPTVLDGSGNPAVSGDWDSGQFGMAHVIWDGEADEYKMYYCSNGAYHPFAIGLATSPDGVTWEKYPDNPILVGDPATWEGENLLEPYVRMEGPGDYKMWYDNGWGIGYATSSDGIHWDKYPAPVFEPEPGSWDSDMVRTPSVVWTGSEYLMAYEGHDGSWNLFAGVATSPNGIDWTRYEANPVLGPGDPGAFDEYAIYRLDMAYDGSQYRLIYGGSSPGPLELGIATSPDGFTWTRYPDNPVFGAGHEPWENWVVWSAGLLWDDPVWKMYYAGVGEGGHAIGLATSGDGLEWVRDSEHNPVLEPGWWGEEGAPVVRIHTPSGGGLAGMPAWLEELEAVRSPSQVQQARTEAVLDGLTITGGFFGDGAGVNIDDADVTLQHCTIAENEALNDGGGILVGGGGMLQILASDVLSNTAGNWGGGINAFGVPSLTLEAVTVRANRSLEGEGGGLVLWDGTGASLSGVVVEENSAEHGAGGVNVGEGTVIGLGDVEIVGNTSRWSAGLRVYGGSRVDGNRVWIQSNVATDENSGGFELSEYSTMTLTNALITGNSGAAGGVGVSSTLTLTNATVADNTHSSGEGGIGVGESSEVAVLNSILFYNGDSDLGCDGTSTCLVEYSDVEHPWAGEGNLSIAPEFVHRPSGDYHLLAVSPCIDEASAAYAPDDDIDGDGRPYDGDGSGSAEPDMGADEYTGEPAMHDVAVVGAAPGGWVPAGDATEVRAELYNGGNYVEDLVPVACSIKDPSSSTVYDEAAVSDAIQPGTWGLVDFPDWIPAVEGEHTLTCQSSLPGDQNPDNDLYTQVVTVTVAGAPDVWTRDNKADTGDVPTSPPWWVSPDIWVRHQPDGGLVHENPNAFEENTVYVRLRNRGEVATSGTVSVFWSRSRIGWPCRIEEPNVGTIAFEDLAPDEERIVGLTWVPERVGHHGLHTVIDAEGDPPDWDAPCSPHRPRYDNNISWHNVIVFRNEAVTLHQASEVSEAEVQVVNLYDFARDVDVIVDRPDFPATDMITIRLPEELFDRWLDYEGGWSEGVEVLAAKKEIQVTGAISATLGAVPMSAGEEVTATLIFTGTAGQAFEMGLRERIDGLIVGGVAYQWVIPDVTPPEVVSTSPGYEAASVALDAPVVITFTELIGPLSLDLVLEPDPGGWSVTWNQAGTVVTATHTSFAASTTYQATVEANDAWGNALAPVSWPFTTREWEYRIYLPLVMNQTE